MRVDVEASPWSSPATHDSPSAALTRQKGDQRAVNVTSTVTPNFATCAIVSAQVSRSKHRRKRKQKKAGQWEHEKKRAEYA